MLVMNYAGFSEGYPKQYYAPYTVQEPPDVPTSPGVQVGSMGIWAFSDLRWPDSSLDIDQDQLIASVSWHFMLHSHP